jgi:hypothetical protein
MGKFNKGYGNSNSLGQGTDRAFRQKRDPLYAGYNSRSDRGFGENITQAIWNEAVAPGNNRPGREYLRRGWNNNLGGMASQEIANGFIRGTRPKGKRGW